METVFETEGGRSLRLATPIRWAMALFNPGKGRITPHANGTQSDPCSVPTYGLLAPSRGHREKADQLHSATRGCGLPGGASTTGTINYSYVGGTAPTLHAVLAAEASLRATGGIFPRRYFPGLQPRLIGTSRQRAVEGCTGGTSTATVPLPTPARGNQSAPAWGHHRLRVRRRVRPRRCRSWCRPLWLANYREPFSR